MALTSIRPISGAPGHMPIQIGNALGQTQTVTAREVTTELTSRNYLVQTTSPSITPSITWTPVTQTTTPAMTKQQAITKAVDSALATYGYAKRSTRIGGYSLTGTRFNSIVNRAVTLANGYLAAASVQTRSFTFSGAPALGQAPNGYGIFPGWTPITDQQQEAPALPEMTTWEKIALIASGVKAGLTTFEAYANARAERERVGITATLTAQQVKQMVNQAITQNPTLNRDTLMAAAAGAGGREEPKGMPSWVVPVVIGTAVIGIMMVTKGR